MNKSVFAGLSVGLLWMSTAQAKTLTALNVALVDESSRSLNSDTSALIDFVNQSEGAVDIYWINFEGNRVRYAAGLAKGATWTQLTFLTHPWLVVASGTGGSTARKTGTLLAGFQAVTPRNPDDPSFRDTAIITGTTTSLGVYQAGKGISSPSVLSPDGTPQDCTVTKSMGYGLDEKTIEAARKWRFTPGAKVGQPVPVWATISQHFAAAPSEHGWRSGPMVFASEPGRAKPVVIDGSMPPVGQPFSNESAAANGTITFVKGGGDETFGLAFGQGRPLNEQVRDAVTPHPPPVQPGPDFYTGLGYPVYTVKQGATGPRVLHQVDPKYSEEARKAKLNGTVILAIIVDAKGNVARERVLRGIGMGLDEKAIAAVKKWKFNPGSKDGEPVAVLANVQVNFKLLTR